MRRVHSSRADHCASHLQPTMPSLLIQSIALVSLLVASPSNAFGITTSLTQRCCDGPRRPSSLRISSFDSSSFSSSSAASDENGSSSQQQQQQQQQRHQQSNAQQEWPGGSSRHRSDEARLDEMDTRPATSCLPQRRRASSDGDESTNDNEIHQHHHHSRSSEFNIRESPLPAPSTKRRERLERERAWQSSYEFISPGTDAYWDLKDTIRSLRMDLRDAAAANAKSNSAAILDIKNMLVDARRKDPEYIYGKTSYYLQHDNNRVDNKRGVGVVENDNAREEEEVIERNKEQNRAARQKLPQFNLEGLWVGKYGSHGFEMINVTYIGDRLIAYKVTGDKNIPRGEITFTVDLSPTFVPNDDDDYEEKGSSDQRLSFSQLEPIQLSESSAKKWGTRRLSRFRGQGHAAEPGYTNHQYMEGQLVVIGKGTYFSFAWVPLEHQIFFGRPSPELIVRMLKEGGGSRLTAGVGLDVPSLDANVKEQTEYVDRCFEVTCDVLWEESLEGKVDPYSCIWHGDDDEYCYFE